MTIADKVRQHIPPQEPENIKEWARNVCDLLKSEGIETTHKYVENVYFRTREAPEEQSKPNQSEIKKDYRGDGATFEYKGEKSIQSLEEAISFFEIDLNTWEVDRWTANSWDVSMKVKGDNVVKKTNYQVKVWLKKKSKDFERERQAVLDLLKLESPKSIKTYPQSESNVLEPCLYDVHLGCLIWGKECGQDWDVEITNQTFVDSLRALMQKSSGFKFEKVLYIVGQDFFNSDKSSPYAQTTAGTVQNDDGRYHKIISAGNQMQILAVKELLEIAPVEIVVMPGNHDTERAFHLGEVLKYYFYNNKHVTVDNSPLMFKFWEYGNNLLGFNHGHRAKFPDLYHAMTQLAAPQWGRTKYREMHIGHNHHEAVTPALSSKDINGMIVRQMRSVCPPDEWHGEKPYISDKGADAYVWNKWDGLESILRHNVKYPEL